MFPILQIGKTYSGWILVRVRTLVRVPVVRGGPEALAQQSRSSRAAVAQQSQNENLIRDLASLGGGGGGGGGGCQLAPGGAPIGWLV